MENSIAADTQLYELFRETLGKDKAEQTVNHIRTIAKSEVGSRIETLATGKQLSDLEMRVNERFNDLELRLVDRIHKAQVQTIIWIVTIGVLQFGASYLLRM